MSKNKIVSFIIVVVVLAFVLNISYSAGYENGKNKQRTITVAAQSAITPLTITTSNPPVDYPVLTEVDASAYIQQEMVRIANVKYGGVTNYVMVSSYGIREGAVNYMLYSTVPMNGESVTGKVDVVRDVFQRYYTVYYNIPDVAEGTDMYVCLALIGDSYVSCEIYFNVD